MALMLLLDLSWPVFVRTLVTRRDLRQRRRPVDLARAHAGARSALRCSSLQGLSELIKRDRLPDRQRARPDRSGTMPHAAELELAEEIRKIAEGKA